MFMLLIQNILVTQVFHVFKSFPQLKLFVVNQTLFNSTQYSDLFVTYTDGFKMHTGQPNPHSMIDNYISGKIVLDTSSNKFIFPALNVSNNFATIDYNEYINTKLTTLLTTCFAQ